MISSDKLQPGSRPSSMNEVNERDPFNNNSYGTLVDSPYKLINLPVLDVVDFNERIIRGYLAGHIPGEEIATWQTPVSTPELIRDIAGRLVAAFRYRKLYSEDVNEISPYAQNLYTEAINMLNMIVSGELTIVSLVDEELVDLERGAGLSRMHFYPTDDQVDERKFGMDLTF